MKAVLIAMAIGALLAVVAAIIMAHYLTIW
jgi:type II secretory pathway component PulJ